MTTHMETAAGVPGWEMRHRLRRSLEVSGLSAEDMADFLEVHPNTVRNWMGGRVQPRASTLRQWSLRTGVPYEWIRTGTVSEHDPNAGGPISAPRPKARRSRFVPLVLAAA